MDEWLKSDASIPQNLLSNKREWTTITCNNLDKSTEYYAEWVKPIHKGYIPYDSIYITFWNVKMKMEHGKWLQGAKEGLKMEGGKVGYTWATWGILLVMKMFISGLYQRWHHGCIIAL